MKKIVVLFILIVIFLGFDYQAYYYGLGKGFLSKKIPKEFRLLFSGSDLSYDGVIIEENSVGGTYLVRNRDNLMLENGRELSIKIFLGYYFDDKNIVIKILDNNNKMRYVKIYSREDSVNNYYYYYFYEIKNIIKNYKYINVNHSQDYFSWIIRIKNFIFIIIILMIINLLIKGVLRTSLFDSNINYD